MIRTFLATALVVCGGAAIAADLKSGPQTGEMIPGPFHPLNVNGEDAGKKACLYCKGGDSPVVAIFARSADDAKLKKLITTLEDATVKNAKAELNGFVVFCSNNDKLQAKLKEFAEKAELKNVILAIDEPARTSTTSARTPISPWCSTRSAWSRRTIPCQGQADRQGH